MASHPRASSGALLLPPNTHRWRGVQQPSPTHQRGPGFPAGSCSPSNTRGGLRASLEAAAPPSATSPAPTPAAGRSLEQVREAQAGGRLQATPGTGLWPTANSGQISRPRHVTVAALCTHVSVNMCMYVCLCVHMTLWVCVTLHVGGVCVCTGMCAHT